ncbi:MAG TPA: hypothetical protein VI121_05745, partial [Agromyces sp.]
MTGSGSDETTAGEYGANEWLVDEMYQKYLADPDSVDKTWWPVLEHYRRAQTTDVSAPATPTQADRPQAEPAAPAPAPDASAPAATAPPAPAPAAPAPEAPAPAAQAPAAPAPAAPAPAAS